MQVNRYTDLHISLVIVITIYITAIYSSEYDAINMSM